MQNQTNAKHFSTYADIFKSTKNISEQLISEVDSSNTTTSKVLSKIPNIKNLKSNNITFQLAKISLEVHGV